MLTMTAVGRIGRDVELRRTGAGDPVCNVVIGCNYGKRDDNTTQWVEGTLWGARAEGLAEHLTKGKQVILVLDDVHIETYEGANGPGTKLVGRVQGLEFGASPQGDQGGGQQRSQGGQQRQQSRGNDTRDQGARDTRGGYGDRGNSSRGTQQRQQPAAQQRTGGSSGFDDMDDDIPF